MALNLSFHTDLKKRIILEATGSGSIVQNICQRICMIKRVYNTQVDNVFINNNGVFETACTDIANESKSFYEKAFVEIAKGGRSDGSTAENDIPQTGLKNTDVFHQLQAMGHGRIDQSTVTAGLKYLPTLLKKNNLPTLVDYDESGKTFFLLDNYMKFVMKWVPETLNLIQAQEGDGSMPS